MSKKRFPIILILGTLISQLVCLADDRDMYLKNLLDAASIKRPGGWSATIPDMERLRNHYSTYAYCLNEAAIGMHLSDKSKPYWVYCVTSKITAKPSSDISLEYVRRCREQLVDFANERVVNDLDKHVPLKPRKIGPPVGDFDHTLPSRHP